jgi:hypothetical protein
MPLVFESGRQVKENRDEPATLGDARTLAWGQVAYPLVMQANPSGGNPQ